LVVFAHQVVCAVVFFFLIRVCRLTLILCNAAVVFVALEAILRQQESAEFDLLVVDAVEEPQLAMLLRLIDVCWVTVFVNIRSGPARI